MYSIRKVNEDTYWLGASDRRISLFENNYPVDGMSYNTYLIKDEKTCLMDGIDAACEKQFLENLDAALDGRTLDYMVVQHMEPDHCAVIPLLVEKYPDLRIAATGMALRMMNQFFDFDISCRSIVETEGKELSLGKHTLKFVLAPMVHWPEVMVTYDELTKTLFSADAFGCFGALNGNIFADEVNWERDWADEARRYYVNIVGKYGAQTSALLKKASGLDLAMICPLHGHIWRQDFDALISRYQKWAAYEPEVDSTVIFVGSVYGNTENAADILASKLAEKGQKNIIVFNASRTPVSEMVSRAFQYSHLVFAASTYNMQIFDPVQELIEELQKHNLGNRKVGLIENGSWAPASGSLMANMLSGMKGMDVCQPVVHLKSSVKKQNLDELEALADALIAK